MALASIAASSRGLHCSVPAVGHLLKLHRRSSNVILVLAGGRPSGLGAPASLRGFAGLAFDYHLAAKQARLACHELGHTGCFLAVAAILSASSAATASSEGPGLEAQPLAVGVLHGPHQAESGRWAVGQASQGRG